MGGLLISTLGTLAPKAYYLFVIVVAVGFFGVYVPWNEKKKRQGGSRGPAQKTGKEGKPAVSDAMSRFKAVMELLACIPMLTVGLIMLIASAVIGIPILIALGAVLSVIAMVRLQRAGQAFRAQRQPKPRERKAPTPPPTFRAQAPDHEHITPAGPSAQRRLEQLETLREAGILTKEEYREKRTELLEGRK